MTLLGVVAAKPTIERQAAGRQDFGFEVKLIANIEIVLLYKFNGYETMTCNLS